MLKSTNPFTTENVFDSNLNVGNTTNTINTINTIEWSRINKLPSIESGVSLQTIDRSMSSLSTSTSSSTSTTSTADNNDDITYLQTVDPLPVEPPLYDSVNPSRRITFPVYETRSNDSNLPVYTPAVDCLTLAAIRLEYIDPETHASLLRSKVWSNFIVEINSTQLNLYAIDPMLTSSIKNYRDSVNPLTSKKLSTQQPQTHRFTSEERERILDTIKTTPDQFLNSATLRRTYTLQHAEFGLPSDFIRRNKLGQDQVNVLRIRCENQQFLIRLADIDELINWSTKLSEGIAVSLDLQIRNIPDYKVFPRRRNRHRHRDRTDSVTSSVVSSRSASPSRAPSSSYPLFLVTDSPASTSGSDSASASGSGSGSPTFLSRSSTNISSTSSSGSIFRLPSSTASSSTGNNIESNGKNLIIKRVIGMFNKKKTNSARNNNNSVSTLTSVSVSASASVSALRSRSASISNVSQRTVAGSRSNRSVSVTNSIMETERSIQHHSNERQTVIHERDEEDMDFYSDDEDDVDNNEELDLDGEDIKWRPVPKITNREKHISTSLRCLPVFNETHSWLGKIILKESHNPTKYDTINLPIYFINTATMSKEGTHHMRIKNHCLHPYVLSPNGLIKHGSKVFDLWYEMYK